VLVALNVAVPIVAEAHTGLHKPLTQVVDEVPEVEHTVPQAPQLLTSVERLRQVPEQLVWPVGQPHEPLVHTPPAGAPHEVPLLTLVHVVGDAAFAGATQVWQVVAGLTVPFV